MCALLALPSEVQSQGTEKIELTTEEVGSMFVRNHAERDWPYSVTFVLDGEKSVYIFEPSGTIKKFKAGSEKYKFKYKPSGALNKVVRIDSGARMLHTAHGGEEDASGILDVPQQRHRRLYACDDCERIWDIVCGTGLASACGPPDSFSSVFGPLATSSMVVMCSTFASLCDSTTASAACEGQCDEGCGEACGISAECVDGACVCPEGYEGDPLTSCSGKTRTAGRKYGRFVNTGIGRGVNIAIYETRASGAC